MYILYIAFVFIVILAVLFVLKKSYQRYIVLFEKQAVKRKGTILKGTLFTPKLKFFYKNHEITMFITPGSRYSPPYIHVRFQFNTLLHFSMTIYRESLSSTLGKKLGIQDVVTGSESFDAAFIIKASDELSVMRLLPYEMQEKLLSIKEKRPNVTLKDNSLELKCPKIPKNEEEYDNIIETALGFIDVIT
jgi:hypothetical protein